MASIHFPKSAAGMNVAATETIAANTPFLVLAFILLGGGLDFFQNLGKFNQILLVKLVRANLHDQVVRGFDYIAQIFAINRPKCVTHINSPYFYY
jgi:hypothetical protein